MAVQLAGCVVAHSCKFLFFPIVLKLKEHGIVGVKKLCQVLCVAFNYLPTSIALKMHYLLECRN